MPIRLKHWMNLKYASRWIAAAPNFITKWQLAFRSGQKKLHIIIFKRSLVIDSNYAPAVMGLGQTLSEKIDNQAITQFGKVLNINKGFHSAYKSRGIAEYMSEDYAAAIDDFTTYLLFEDNDGPSYYYRGLSEIGNKNIMDGCSDLTVAMRYKYYAAQKMIDKYCAGIK